MSRSLRAATHYSERSKSISFIGLGRMGYEMANNLFSKVILHQSSDYTFNVCDASPDTAERFKAEFIQRFPAVKSVNIVSSPQEAVNASSVVVTMLPSSPHVQSVYSESGGIIPALRALGADSETLCIDSTTLDVQIARDVSRQVGEAGASMVDAPVSGGVSGAKAATLTFLVGGQEDTFNSAFPHLSHMGKRVIHCGPSGAGLGAKICNNLILGVQQIVAAEAMLLGQNLQLDPAILASVISTSTGASWSMSVNNPVPGALPGNSPPCEREYEGGFASALMLKDMGLATDLAAQYDSPLPLAAAATELYKQAIAKDESYAKKDFSVLYEYLKKHASQSS
ncbi:3-hydroxyisobutyrate dehydrogenase [Pterulicium gracile]|uniref:3-hydroxyisobutyrate dehydrogenase n=1 Tax=Pterulicium gracile TaxID=1884261 RepID=A0A5C3R1B4_9AGAR|nr:3-hydroxyisobutyrate dehydrogenase [Pterula gracilis]